MAKFENRHLYIGGSDFGTVCGVNPYKSRESLALEKAQVIANQFEGNEATKRGELLEDRIIELFENETGKKVTDQQKEFERAETPHEMALKAHVDGLTEDAVFEAKTTDIKGNVWDKGIPEYYVKQLEMNCYLSKRKKAYIAVGFCSGDEIVDFKWFEYIPQMAEPEILYEVAKFTELVKKLREEYGVINNGEIVEAEIDMDLVTELENIKEELQRYAVMISPLETRKKQIEKSLKEQIGINAGIRNEVFEITLGNRVSAPKNELSICRTGLKVKYRS